MQLNETFHLTLPSPQPPALSRPWSAPHQWEGQPPSLTWGADLGQWPGYQEIVQIWGVPVLPPRTQDTPSLTLRGSIRRSPSPFSAGTRRLAPHGPEQTGQMQPGEQGVRCLGQADKGGSALHPSLELGREASFQPTREFREKAPNWAAWPTSPGL